MNDHTRAQAGPADALWQRLQRWQPQDESFARHLELRLRQRHGWDAVYIARAVQEYRRFMWLLVTHQGAQCPSEAVDAVWHEHLLDSKTYFEQFCPQVLQVTMHHVPNRGGARESQRHRDNYARCRPMPRPLAPPRRRTSGPRPRSAGTLRLQRRSGRIGAFPSRAGGPRAASPGNSRSARAAAAAVVVGLGALHGRWAWLPGWPAARS